MAKATGAAAREVIPLSPRPPQVTRYTITDEGLPSDRLIYEGVDLADSPLFTISEVAKVFFGRSAHWVRWRERSGVFVFDGEPVGKQRTPKGARVYTLGDIEKMAHALAESGAISGIQLANILRLVLIVGKVWGVLEQ